MKTKKECIYCDVHNFCDYCKGRKESLIEVLELVHKIREDIKSNPKEEELILLFLIVFNELENKIKEKLEK